MKNIRTEVFRQVALYAGVDKKDISGESLLYDELGMDPLVILMLLITLAESLGKNVFTLRFELENLNSVDDLVTVFHPPAVSVSQPRVRYCLH